MAVWRPQHENTLIVELAVSNLYDKVPYGGSVGGFYKRFRHPAALPPTGFLRIICGSSLGLWG